MTEAQRNWIDKSSYETLLQKWRNAPPGDLMFTGEVGDYYTKMMAEKRDADPDGAVAASKSIGW